MTRLLKLMADYGCFPLWESLADGVRNVDPVDLPLSSELRADLLRWAAAYDRTLNQEYPPDSGFAGPEAEAAFEAEGRRLWADLRSQLGAAFKVAYFCSQHSRLLEPPPSESNLPLPLNRPA